MENTYVVCSVCTKASKVPGRGREGGGGRGGGRREGEGTGEKLKKKEKNLPRTVDAGADLATRE